MFLWLNKQGVESDKGFVVQFVSRYGMEYRQGDRRMQLGVESGVAGFIYVQYPKERWDAPHMSEVIGPQEREQIRANIAEALRFQHLEPEFDITH